MKTSGKLTATTERPADLDEQTRDAMWRLFRTYYRGAKRPTFERDLHAKDHVIVLRDSGDGSVQGLSTLVVLEREVDAGGNQPRRRKVTAIFSGDTIIAEDYWGQTALQRAFFAYILKTKAARPLRPVYWFLISKGFKTYLLLSRNFPEHWPRHDQPTPPWQQALLHDLGSDLFGPHYDAETGVLRFADRGQDKDRLKAGVASIGADELAHDDIRFFAESNPGHGRGDELCCLGLVDLNLARSYTTKLLGKTARRTVRAVTNQLPTPALADLMGLGR